MKVYYIPIWFAIKDKNLWYHGPKHLFNLLSHTRLYVPELFTHVKNSVMNNAFSVHPENLLLAMIADQNRDVRRKGYAKILACREAASDGLRKFMKPCKAQFNFACHEYHELLKWNKVEVTEPPFTKNLSNVDLKHWMNSDDIISLPEIPVHSQSCEYYVQAGSKRAWSRWQEKLTRKAIS